MSPYSWITQVVLLMLCGKEGEAEKLSSVLVARKPKVSPTRTEHCDGTIKTKSTSTRTTILPNLQCICIILTDTMFQHLTKVQYPYTSIKRI